MVLELSVETLNPRTGCNWLQLVFLCVGCGRSGCEWSWSSLSRNLSKGQLVAVLVESKKGKRLDQTRLSNTNLKEANLDRQHGSDMICFKAISFKAISIFGTSSAKHHGS